MGEMMIGFAYIACVIALGILAAHILQAILLSGHFMLLIGR